MADQAMFPWRELEQYFRGRLAQVDHQLRRTKGEEAAELRGKAQLLEELVNLPQVMAAIRGAVAKGVPNSGSP